MSSEASSRTARALAREIFVAPLSAPANTTPTAIPSGRLWMVTARASIAVFDRCERMPSGLSVPICRCGVSSSISNRFERFPAKRGKRLKPKRALMTT